MKRTGVGTSLNGGTVVAALLAVVIAGVRNGRTITIASSTVAAYADYVATH